MESTIKLKGHIRDGNPVWTVIFYILAILAAVICIYPLYYVLCLSISSSTAVNAQKVYLYPIDIQFNSFKLILGKLEMWKAFGMSMFYVVTSTVCMLLSCVLAAYPLSSPNLIGRRVITFFILIPMYFSGGLIPTFMVMKMFGLYNNIWAIIVSHGYSIWYIILCRTYFMSIPESLREAAKIDGANSYQTLFKVYLPLVKPILAVIAIYTIVNVWNGWYTASIYLLDKDLQPLQLYLRRILISMTQKLDQATTQKEMEMLAATRLSNISLQYAMIIFSTLPVIFTYPFFQKYFVKGVMLGSLKG